MAAVKRVADNPDTWTQQERETWDQRYGTNWGGKNTAPPAAPAAPAAPTPTTAPGPGTTWTPADGGLQAGGPAAPTGPQNTAQVLTGTATPGQQTPQGQPTTVTGAFQQALLNRMAPQAVNAQNPEIAPAIQANQLAEQRGEERNRAQLAEMAAAQGWNDSGAFDSQRLGLSQQRAAREGAFEGNAVQGLGDRQAKETLAALGLGGSLLGQQDVLGMQKYGIDTGATSAKEQRDLQRYGIDTDAALRREGLGMQGDLGGRELDIRDKLGSGQLNLGLLGQLLQNQQFGQNLGANLGMFGANLNQNALLSLLGQF